MAATSLPLELQQQIFTTLDLRSFHSARRVCKWWCYASMNSMTLSKQFRKLPMYQQIDIESTTPQKLHSLFTYAAHTLLFGIQATEESSMSTVPWKVGVRPKMAASKDRTKLVTLNDRTLTFFDGYGLSAVPVVQKRLEGLRDLPVGFPGLQPQSSAQHHLALSSNGDLLAVAMDRTIQIYDLSEQSECEAVTRHIADACDRRVARLDFEHDDHMLRVQLTGDGTVLYLGSPAQRNTAEANLSHWRGDSGLRHTFVDSSRLSMAQTARTPIRFSGLQLLRPFGNGYIFAAQRHGGAESSRYLVGHVRCSSNAYTSTQAAENASVTKLALLESFLSSRDYAMKGLSEIRMGGWETMPSAHEDPRFGMLEDLVVVAERDKKSARAGPHWTQLFLYRLPSERRMLGLLESNDSCSQKACTNDAELREAFRSIPRIPQCIGAVAGEVKVIQLSKTISDDRSGCRLMVVTDEATRAWNVASS